MWRNTTGAVPEWSKGAGRRLERHPRTLQGMSAGIPTKARAVRGVTGGNGAANRACHWIHPGAPRVL